MIDLDHFKAVNDNYGHSAGDKVLKNMANVFSKNLREEDIVGRIGGEEFAVILPEIPQSEVWQTAERIRKAVKNQPVVWSESEIRITASLGVVAGSPREGQELVQWLKKADQALYSAKSLGRNQAVSAE